jgi:hypothetical protein
MKPSEQQVQLHEKAIAFPVSREFLYYAPFGAKRAVTSGTARQ